MSRHDAVTEAAILDACANIRRESAEIATLCYLAGCSAMAAEFIRGELNVASVRRRLESLPAVEPVKQPPPAGNGSFDLRAIEQELAAGRTVQ